jgi:hypothetical protein
MAYTKENKYKKIIEVQEYFKTVYSPGMTIEWVYHNKIKTKFHISRTTFLNYLNTPAEKLLKELTDEKTENKTAFKQLTMGFVESTDPADDTAGSD